MKLFLDFESGRLATADGKVFVPANRSWRESETGAPAGREVTPTEAVEWLLANGAIPTKEGELRAPLKAAAWAGADDIVRLLIDRDPEALAASPLAHASLRDAAQAGHRETVALLLNEGAEPPDDLLHAAIRGGSPELVSDLLERGMS